MQNRFPASGRIAAAQTNEPTFLSEPLPKLAGIRVHDFQRLLKSLQFVADNAKLLNLPWIQCNGLTANFLSVVNRQPPAD